MDSEAIFVAFKAKIDQMIGPSVKSVSRKLLHWNDVPAEDQPAVFIAQGNRNPFVKSWNLPYGWDLSAKIYIYVSVQEGENPSSVLNPILDLLNGALTPEPNVNKVTLGGLCQACFISGEIETFEGTLGSQEVAIVPVSIIVR